MSAHHDAPWTIDELASAVRRWIGEETFQVPDAANGVHLLDDQAARYGDFDDMTIVGLIENEWPERPRRNIFYPPALLKSLGWPTEKDRRAADEARFLDLLASPSRDIALSAFTLDDEALVTRSILLDEVPRARLSARPARSNVRTETVAIVHDDERDWARLRAGRSSSDVDIFHGAAGSRLEASWSVSALETYTTCPFKFFAQHILKLEEEPDDEEVMDPRRQGQFVHKVFETFFSEWQAVGTPRDYRRRTSIRPARCSPRSWIARSRICRKAKPGSNEPGCSDRRPPPDLAKRCFAWKPSARCP